jgi:hypothetical protein
VKISCIELHCDTIKDLLDPERQPETQVVKEGKRFKPLEILVTCQQDVSSIMDTANKNRSQAATNMNLHSSRSHCLY